MGFRMWRRRLGNNVGLEVGVRISADVSGGFVYRVTRRWPLQASKTTALSAANPQVAKAFTIKLANLRSPR